MELAQAYSEHAIAMSVASLFSRGVRYAERSLSIRRALGDSWGQGQSLHFYGIVLYAAARYRDCIEKCRVAARLLDQTGDRWEVNMARYHVAFALYRIGALREAIHEARCVYQAGLVLGDSQAAALSLEIWSKASGGRVPSALIRMQLQQSKEDVERKMAVLQADGARRLALGQPGEAAGAYRKPTS